MIRFDVIFTSFFFPGLNFNSTLEQKAIVFFLSKFTIYTTLTVYNTV